MQDNCKKTGIGFSIYRFFLLKWFKDLFKNDTLDNFVTKFYGRKAMIVIFIAVITISNQKI
jgi:hypothetical protein